MLYFAKLAGSGPVARKTIGNEKAATAKPRTGKSITTTANGSGTMVSNAPNVEKSMR